MGAHPLTNTAASLAFNFGLFLVRGARLRFLPLMAGTVGEGHGRLWRRGTHERVHRNVRRCAKPLPDALKPVPSWKASCSSVSLPLPGRGPSPQSFLRTAPAPGHFRSQQISASGGGDPPPAAPPPGSTTINPPAPLRIVHRSFSSETPPRPRRPPHLSATPPTPFP